jgi:hypothetical protein
MRTPTLLLLRLPVMLLALALAAAPAPAGLRTPACGIAIVSSDPELHASFERFDRGQSPTAARVCAIFLNNTPAT